MRMDFLKAALAAFWIFALVTVDHLILDLAEVACVCVYIDIYLYIYIYIHTYIHTYLRT